MLGSLFACQPRPPESGVPCFIKITSVYACCVWGGEVHMLSMCDVHAFSSGSRFTAAPVPLPCSLELNPPPS